MPASSILAAAALKELLLVVRSARLRVEAGEAPDFATAMEGVIVDLLTLNGAPPASRAPATMGLLYIGE